MKRLLHSFAVDMSIKKKLMVSYGILLLIIGGITIIGFESILHFYVIKQTTTSLENQTELVKRAIEIHNNEIENYVTLVCMDDYVQNGLQKLDEMDTWTLYAYNNNFIKKSIVYGMIAENNIQCQILTKDGTVAFKQEHTDFNVDVNLLENFTGDEKWTGIQEVSKEGDENKAYIVYLKKILGYQTGKLQGYVACYINEKNYNDTFFMKGEKEGGVLLLDEEDKVISSNEKAYIGYKFDELFQNNKEELKNGNMVKGRLNGELVYAYSSSLNDGWNAVQYFDYWDVMSDNIFPVLLISFATVMGMMFAVVMSIRLTRTISKPIINLTDIIQKIGEGDLNQRVHFYGKDEIGILGKNFNKMMERIDELMKEIYNEQEEKQYLEVSLLQAQINPHFLYNAFESVVSYIKLDMKKEAIGQIRNLASFYRLSLSNGENMITVQKELQLTHDYLEIQKVRYADILEYEFVVDESILTYKIPKLTIQPIVENAIYHGLKEKGTRGMITITLLKKEETIIILVHDNGKGMGEKELKNIRERLYKESEEKSFGLYCVNQRLQLLFGNEYGISINSEENKYTEVKIRLPLEEILI